MQPKTLLESITNPFRQFIRNESSSGVLLIIATVIALVWANSPLAPAYFSLWDTPVSISIGENSFSKPLLLWVNDGLMAIFFFTIGLEIKKEVLDGELSTPRKAALPLLAAVGGMIMPVGLFFLLQEPGAGMKGWGIPMATDIAFSIGILSLLGSRVPLGMKVFLTAFAIVDDIGAILVITIFYSHEVHWHALAISGGILAFLFLCNYVLSIKRNWVYLLGGLGVWYYMFMSGIHPTIAGVLVAMAVPATNKLRARRFAHRIEDFLDEFRMDKADAGGPFIPDVELNQLQDLRSRARSVLPPLQRLEYQLNDFVAFFVMPLFALANAGIKFSGGGEVFGQPLFLNIAVSLVLGKVLGIVLFSWLAVKLRFADLPLQTNWVHMIGLGLMGGIGFTMALFISNLALDASELLAQAKLGILAGSFVAAVGGYFLLRQSLDKESKQPEDVPAAGEQQPA
ncbi:MAG: Na+/H+ antiporter NhaA [Phaeodactylibacter sp.]|uniref:Na+/H+ antiporter NhaA n=1 Tax=Phaeodactylibacter sp. TaxID=1940289 RepID=UPI0032ECFBE9